MKKLLLIGTIASLSMTGAFAQNYSDDLDRNTVPEAIEERKGEVVNQSDLTDENAVPSSLEEREQEEEIESDMIQRDDPDKTFDPADKELDEQELEQERQEDEYDATGYEDSYL